MTTERTIFCPNNCDDSFLTRDDTADHTISNNGEFIVIPQSEYNCESCGWSAMWTRGNTQLEVLDAGLGSVEQFTSDNLGFLFDLADDYSTWIAEPNTLAESIVNAHFKY